MSITINSIISITVSTGTFSTICNNIVLLLVSKLSLKIVNQIAVMGVIDSVENKETLGQYSNFI
jgi:dUTPase